MPKPLTGRGGAPVFPGVNSAAQEPSQDSSRGAVTRRVLSGFFLGLAVLGLATGSEAAAPRPAKPETTISTQMAQMKSTATMKAGALQTEEARKGAALEGMIVKDAPIGAPSAADVGALKKTLSRVDGAVLDFAREHGTQFVIVRTGQNLLDAGVIEKLDPASVYAGAEAQGKVARGALISAERTYASKLEDVKSRLARYDALPEELGGPGPSVALSRASNEDVGVISDLYAELRGHQEKQKAGTRELLEERTGGVVKIFNPAEGLPVESSSFDAMARANIPQTTEQMARTHGASTSEEVRRFAGAVESLNGGRLEKMRSNTLAQLESSLRTASPAERQSRQSLLERYRANPGEIPLDHINNPVLVPNLYFYRPSGSPGAKAITVNVHDYSSLNNWNDASGKIKSVQRGAAEQGVLAQHFSQGGKNTIVIRNTALEGRSAIHELGHAVESIIETVSPEFSRELSSARDLAYSHLSEEGEEGYHPPVTNYAGASASENLSEGFSLYFSNPRLLQQKDPELHRVVEKEVNFIRSMQRN